MITVSMLGGLGNQMFQYAAAKSLATRHGVSVAFDLSGYRTDPLRSFLLDNLQIPEGAEDGIVAAEPRSARRLAAVRWRNRAQRVSLRLGLGSLPQLSETYAQPGFQFDPRFAELEAPVALFGYFQSERYFADISGKLREYFQPRCALSAAAQTAAEKIASSELPVSLHVRRGDYVTSEATARVHGALEASYYQKSLSLLQGIIGREITIFVFSDDAAEAERVLSFVPEANLVPVRGDPHRPWEDLALMARCRHHVIANSSFSWWGAWLNPSVDKIVVAPRQWFSAEMLRHYNTCDLYPESWILI
jgi:hypothetical protein